MHYRLSIHLSLYLAVATELIAQTPAPSPTAAILRTPSTPAAEGAMRSDAPPPVPVSPAEQAALAQPQQADVPPAITALPRLAAAIGHQPSATQLLAMNGLATQPIGRATGPVQVEGGGWFAPQATKTIRFADYMGLAILPQAAGATFASSPFYIESCGTGWVHVKENDVARYGAAWGSGYGHYHLMYEAGPFCLPANGTYGYELSILNYKVCVPVTDPAAQARFLASHHGTQWIRVYVYKSGVAEMNFDFRGIRVRDTQGIKLYFRKANGDWLHWNNLTPGTWNTAPYATGIREILFRASNNSASSFSVDDIEVTVN